MKMDKKFSASGGPTRGSAPELVALPLDPAGGSAPDPRLGWSPLVVNPGFAAGAAVYRRWPPGYYSELIMPVTACVYIGLLQYRSPEPVGSDQRVAGRSASAVIWVGRNVSNAVQTSSSCTGVTARPFHVEQQNHERIRYRICDRHRSSNAWNRIIITSSYQPVHFITTKQQESPADARVTRDRAAT